MTVSPILQRVAAVMLLFFLGFFPVKSFLIEPFLMMEAERERQEDIRLLLERFGSIAQRKPELEKLIGAAAESGWQEKLLLSGSTDALAAAGLQTVLNRHLAQNRLRQMRIQPIPQKPGELFQRVGVRVLTEGSMENLQKLFFGLESHLPSLFIDNVSLINRRPQEKNPVAASDPSLQVRFDLIGYRFSSRQEGG